MDSNRRTNCLDEEEEEEENGLASLAEIEARKKLIYNRQPPLCYHSVSPRNSVYVRDNSFSSVSSSRSGRFFDGRFEEKTPHFLDYCFFCKKSIAANRDIFMYKGNLPFCSEECRQEEMDIDEAKEKNLKAMKAKSLRKPETEERESTSANKRYPYHSGACVAG